jgi:hypothetical protein
MDLHIIKDITGMDRHHIGLFATHRGRIDKSEFTDSEIPHGSGNRANIPRILRPYKDDPQVRQLHTRALNVSLENRND